ncbi:MAG TPA: hypothetical protein VFF91_03070 [Pseudoxanthomonas sp.]|nr:hypothetical protein [Pseudoxanthomonas sp.]
MNPKRIALLLFLSLCPLAAPGADAPGLLAFGPEAFQSRDTRLAAWEAVPRERREAIEAYLFGRLGLSSTGVVQLAGAYHDHAGGALLHFQQADLHGSRLVWSVLVDPDELSARVLYHAQEGPASGGPEPIPPTPAGR